MKKYLLILLLIICVPVSASTDYSSLEHESVSSLPEASENTLNKIYDYDNKYFVTEKKYVEGGKRHFQVGDDLAQKYICIDFKELGFNTAEVFNQIPNVLNNKDYTYYQNITDTIKNLYPNYNLKTQNTVRFNTGAFNLLFRSRFDISNYNFRFELVAGFNSETYVFQYDFMNYNTTNYDISSAINKLNDNYCYFNNVSSNKVITYVTVIDETDLFYNLLYVSVDSGYKYEWKEINYSDWYRFNYIDEDLYLFYSFEDISKFNIFSDFDFVSFSDFEKLSITLIINIFYCLFLGLCIYIIIKIFNKFISVLFR